MKKYHFLVLLFWLIIPDTKAQVNLSVFSEVSVITAGPGDELYEAFGHSAIRIKDPVLQLDLIYNYGMFDFDAPNFYTNFTKGKLLYKLARYDFKYFLASYQKDQRWVKAQVLNLTQQERQAFFTFLEQNASPQNAQYLYDPFYNNCASKLRDISQSILGDRLLFQTDSIEQNLSLRTLMNRRIGWNTWGGFGINLALGNKLDKVVAPTAYMYLPDYVYALFKKAELDGKPFVKKEETLLSFPTVNYTSGLLSPIFIFALLAILILWVTYSDFRKNQRTKIIDFCIFLSTGIIGTLLTFLWFFTDHSTTPNNFNVFWAFAPNLIASFIINKEQLKSWVSKYILLLVLLLVLIPILWITQVQVFPIAIIPILLALFIRYLFLLKYLK